MQTLEARVALLSPRCPSPAGFAKGVNALYLNVGLFEFHCVGKSSRGGTAAGQTRSTLDLILSVEAANTDRSGRWLRFRDPGSECVLQLSPRTSEDAAHLRLLPPVEPRP